MSNVSIRLSNGYAGTARFALTNNSTASETGYVVVSTSSSYSPVTGQSSTVTVTPSAEEAAVVANVLSPGVTYYAAFYNTSMGTYSTGISFVWGSIATVFTCSVSSVSWNSVHISVLDSDYGEARNYQTTPVTVTISAEGHETITRYYADYNGDWSTSVEEDIFGLDSETTYSIQAVDSLGNVAIGTQTFTTPVHPSTDEVVFTTSYTAPNVTFQVFLEGYGGQNKLWSPIFSIDKSGWVSQEHDFIFPSWDVYRFGIKILTGEALFDTPVVYTKPVEGDYWDLGITVGEFPSDNEQAIAGWLKNRITPTYEWKKAKETLLDLSNMDSDNFWYEIDKDGKFNVWVDRGDKNVNVFLSYPKNITSMEVSTNADDIVNYIKGDGSADVKQDPLVTGVMNDNASPFTWVSYDKESMGKYWALAEAVRYDSERTITSLQNDLLAEITEKNNLQDVPTIKIENNAITPDQFGLGDIVSVETHDIPYVKNVNGLYKIVGYDIRVDIDGNESVSLTLLNPNENQINSLTFPQLIKNLVNRLHGAR